MTIISHKEYFEQQGQEREAFLKMVNNAIANADTGDELAAVALLIEGADVVELFGRQLRDRIMARVSVINASAQGSEAVRHSKGIGEAMLRLNSRA